MTDSSPSAASLHTLYSDHHGWLRGWLRRRLGNACDAADLAHDTFISVLKAGNAAEIREPRSLLLTIASRLVSQRYRRGRVEKAYLEALTTLPEEQAPSPQSALLALEALIAIDAALEGLPELVREAFLLAHLEGLSYAEIAVRLGVSTSSVKQYLTRANRLEAVSARLGGLNGTAAYRSLSAFTKPTSRGRRDLLTALIGLGTLTAMGAIASRSRAWQQVSADHRTGVGEQRDLTLVDGTRVLLDTDSAIDVRFDTSMRRLRLVAGEVMIETAHASQGRDRPFLVETAEGRIRALGTRFLVRQQEGRTRVAVLESAVEIAPENAAGQKRRLQTGESMSFTRSEFGATVAENPDMPAWTRGQLIADEMRLDEFLIELARYRRGVLRCDPAVAALRFSGVFPLINPDLILSLLPNSLPVQVRQVSRYWVVVEPAR